MKTFKMIISFTLLSFLFIQCNNKDEVLGNKPTSDEPKMISNFSSSNVQTTMLYLGATKYAYLGDTTDVESIFSEFRDNPLVIPQASVADNSPSIQIKLNNTVLSSSSNYTIGDFNTFYGSTVQYTIGITNPSNWDMYIPQKIQIVSPPILNQNDLLPFCYFDNFQLEWNADASNLNGIVVIVDWDGTMYGQNDISGIQIRNVDILPADDGVEVLNNQIFDNIPEDAMATLTILRGNVDIINYQNSTVKLGGQSIVSLPFILVRDMSHYN